MVHGADHQIVWCGIKTTCASAVCLGVIRSLAYMPGRLLRASHFNQRDNICNFIAATKLQKNDNCNYISEQDGGWASTGFHIVKYNPNTVR